MILGTRRCGMVLACAAVVWTAVGQEQGETLHTPASPRISLYGVLFTDNTAGTLYLEDNGAAVPIFTSPGAGRYVALSPDRRTAGLKQIGPSGAQSPALLDIGTGTLHLLHSPVARAGQVSFTGDGRIAFTIDDTLLLTDGVSEIRHYLGSYANLAPVSPDGRHAVFNDGGDQLWLLDLESGVRGKITEGPYGWFGPSWSPDAAYIVYSRLDGRLFIYSIAGRRSVSLGTGQGASWSADSRSIVFHRTTTEGGRIIGSDIYRTSADGAHTERLTDTPDVFEMDPVLTPDGASVVYHTWIRQTVEERRLGHTPAGNAIQSVISVRTSLVSVPSPRPPPPSRTEVVTLLDVPYLNQVYDTPDWFNGHWACAPTQAMMVIAYYRVLPPWPLHCSWPSPGHVTDWGGYVAEQYRFREVDYQYWAEDPNGRAARGGYGYMWTGSFSPHSRMADYYRKHGFTATQSEATPHNAAHAEISAGRPFSMCVLLTQAGHLVLAHGIGAEAHTFVFNDPYGDKNRGYYNYLGKNVQYDWPGYNNGYQNLNQVAWCIATDFPAAAPPDTVVDDLEFSSGFFLSTSSPASMPLWKDFNRGYNGHFWWTITRGPLDGPDTCYASWTPTLPADGEYLVEAFIPFSNATAARYRVRHAGGEDTVFVNQKAAVDAWVPLGTYRFEVSGPAMVVLGDAGATGGQEVVFDAVRWSSAGGVTPVPRDLPALPARVSLSQNYPNPFNGSTVLRFEVPSPSRVTLEITDALGRSVTGPIRRDVAAGRGEFVWQAATLASGVYIVRLTAVDQAGVSLGTAAMKMLLVR